MIRWRTILSMFLLARKEIYHSISPRFFAPARSRPSLDAPVRCGLGGGDLALPDFRSDFSGDVPAQPGPEYFTDCRVSWDCGDRTNARSVSRGDRSLRGRS